jgi:hypothetical protein
VQHPITQEPLTITANPPESWRSRGFTPPRR